MASLFIVCRITCGRALFSRISWTITHVIRLSLMRSSYWGTRFSEPEIIWGRVRGSAVARPCGRERHASVCAKSAWASNRGGHSHS